MAVPRKIAAVSPAQVKGGEQSWPPLALSVPEEDCFPRRSTMRLSDRQELRVEFLNQKEYLNFQ